MLTNRIKIFNSDIDVSRIGLGTVKFGRNEQVKYPTGFDLPDDKTILNLLSLAKDLGINLLDTAPAYGYSEERLGKLLTHRHEWVLCSKAGEEFGDSKSHFDFSEDNIKKSIDKSLQKLKTDYLDILLIHSDGNDVALITDGIFEVLTEAKKQGKIRCFGMSTKTIEGGKLTVDHADVVMVTHNPSYTNEKPVIEHAHQNNKAVFIKKAFASGHLNEISDNDPIQAALDFIFQTQGVTSIITGTINPLHLRETIVKAIKAIEKFC